MSVGYSVINRIVILPTMHSVCPSHAHKLLDAHEHQAVYAHAHEHGHSTVFVDCMTAWGLAFSVMLRGHGCALRLDGSGKVKSHSRPSLLRNCTTGGSRLSNWGEATLPFLPLHSPSLPLILFTCLSLEVCPLNTAWGLGERCKLLQRRLGRKPSGNRIWCILALKSDI